MSVKRFVNGIKIMHKVILFLLDILTICLAFALSLLIRFHAIGNVVQNQLATFLFLLPLVLLLFYFYDLYNHLLYVQRIRIFFRIMKVWLISIIIYVVLGFASKFSFLIESRGFIICFFIILLFLFFFFRLVLAPRLLAGYFSPRNRKIFCKFSGPANKFPTFKRFFDGNVAAGLSLIPTDNADCDIRETFLCSRAKNFGELYRELKSLLLGQKLHIASHLFDELNLNWEWGRIDTIPVYTFYQKGQSFRDFIRRIIDILGSFVALVILFPFFIIIGILIKFDSSGPVLYKQKRSGKDGKEFVLYKFRSMYKSDGKDRKREKEFKNYIEQKIPKGKVLDNEKVTTVGRILRKSSIDELPQFFNVLKGEMTLVGPRPPIPYEVRYYKQWHKGRLSVKPGLTGLWQVYGRGNIPCDSSIFLDLIYVINRSLSLDIKLIFQTIPSVILGRGAY